MMLDHEETISYITEQLWTRFDLTKDDALLYTAFILDTHQSLKEEGIID